ncbi:MAG: glycoside hydrolase family 25 protein [Chitinophagaceae bacterium]
MARLRKYFLAKLLMLISLCGILVVGYWYMKKMDLFGDNDITFVRYPAFGIELPTDFTIHGIDVSRYQKSINWKMVQQMKVENIKLAFSFIKATEGIGFVDDMFRRNWKKSKEAGMVRGAYHYFIPFKSGKAQAENFMETVDLLPGDFPPVLDVETVSGSNAKELKQNVKEWLETVEAAYHVKPIIYTGVDFYARYLGNDFDAYPLWAAHYQQKKEPRVSRSWNIWQHNENGRVDGISTGVDFNAFNGDSLAFRGMLLK